MTRTLANAVRWPLDADEIRVRLSDRTVAQLPVVTRRLWRTVARQPAGSRLRRWLLTRISAAGWAANDQKDWEYLARLYDPEVIVVAGEGMPFDWGTTRGWAETRARLEQSFEALFSDQKPVEAIDLGGPYVALRVAAKLTGEASGIVMTQEMTYLYEIGDQGRIVREWASSNPDEIETWLSERARG